MTDLERFVSPDTETSKKELFRLLDRMADTSDGVIAAEHAISHPDAYNGKIVKRAQEIISPKQKRQPTETKCTREPTTLNHSQLSTWDTRLILREVQPGSTLVLRFKRECINAVAHLEDMWCGTFLEYISEMDHITVLAIMQSGEWGADSNRTIEMRVKNRIDVDWFAINLAKVLVDLTIH